MSEAENKVQFGLRKVHYAVLKDDGTYENPVPVPGAVNMTLDAESNVTKFYADDVLYYVSNSGTSYSGSLEIARFIDQMLVDIWHYVENATDHVLVENALAEPSQFALLFEISGDKNSDLYVLYACSAGKPGIGSATKSDKNEPQTQKCSLDAQPLSDGKIFARTTKATPASVRSAWFTKVYLPAENTQTAQTTSEG